MRLTPRTILGQLVAGTVVIQLLVFVVFLAVSVRHEFNRTQQRDLDRLRKQTGIIVSLVAEPLTENDDDLMDHVMHAVPIAASVKGARLTDTSGNMLRNTSTDLPMVLTPQERSMLLDLATHPSYRSFTRSDGNLEGVQPVLVDGLVRGIVWVTQDSVLALTTPTTVLDSLLIYSPFALVGNLLLVWALSGSMARPLRRLRKASQQVQLDPNDLSAFPLPAAENNEAGELTASVNAMVNEIAMQRQGTQDTLSLLDSMLTGAPIGFGFYDHEYRYVRVNEHLAKMHGVPLADHIGRRLRDLLPQTASNVAGQVEGLIQRVFDTEQPAPDNVITGYMFGASQEGSFQTSYFPVFASGEVRWVGVIATDITARRRAEETARQNDKLAEAGRLATSIANEISNPLESVTNLLSLLRQNADLDIEGQKYLGMAQSEIARVSEITQQTLSFYRQSKVAHEVAMADVVRDVLSLYTSRLQACGIEVDLQAEEQASLFGYPGEFRQMMANLVKSAIDTMPQGGKLRLKIVRNRVYGVPTVGITVGYTGAEANAGVPGSWGSTDILLKHRGRIQVRTHYPRVRGEGAWTVIRLLFPVNGGGTRRPFIVHSSSPALAGR